MSYAPDIAAAYKAQKKKADVPHATGGYVQGKDNPKGATAGYGGGRGDAPAGSFQPAAFGQPPKFVPSPTPPGVPQQPDPWQQAGIVGGGQRPFQFDTAGLPFNAGLAQLLAGAYSTYDRAAAQADTQKADVYRRMLDPSNPFSAIVQEANVFGDQQRMTDTTMEMGGQTHSGAALRGQKYNQDDHAQREYGIRDNYSQQVGGIESALAALAGQLLGQGNQGIFDYVQQRAADPPEAAQVGGSGMFAGMTLEELKRRAGVA